MCQACGDGWRFEATELHTGRVKAVLHPISGTWEELFCRWSTGNLLLATKDPAQEDIWVDQTGIYISRVNRDGSRKPAWAGYVIDTDAAAANDLTVMCNSIDEFLDHRYLVDDNGPLGMGIARTFIPEDPNPDQVVVTRPTSLNDDGFVVVASRVGNTQSDFAAAAVNVQNLTGKGIPLVAITQPPTDLVSFDKTIKWQDFKNLGVLLRELIDASMGVQYRLEHNYFKGTDGWYWSTNIIFSDLIGDYRDYTLRSDYEGKGYGLHVNGTDHASRVFGIGAVSGGESSDTVLQSDAVPMFSVAFDEAENLPEFQSVQTWSDQTIPAALDAQTQGYVQDHRDPVAIPAMSVAGLEWPDAPPPEQLRLGDEIGVDIGYGAATYRGHRAKVLGITWSLQDGAPIERTLALQPVIRASQSVKTQTPAVAPTPTTPLDDQAGAPTVDPWPKAGKVCTVKGSSLTEISGMEDSATTPGYFWAFNDEVNKRQVKLVNKANGMVEGSYGFTPSTDLPGNGDPEAIRRDHLSGRLALADTGDDHTNPSRHNCALYVVPEPVGVGHKGPLEATVYPITYNIGPRNVEALLINPLTGFVQLITKEANRARVIDFVQLAAMSTSGNVGTVSHSISSLKMVSDATHTADGKRVLIRCAGVKATLVYDAVTWEKLGELPTPAMTKSEAITVEGSCSLLTTSEGVNPPVFRVLIPTEFGATCGDVGSGTPGGGTSTVPGQVLDLTRWKLQTPLPG